MLIVTAGEFRNPVVLVVFMEAGDLLVHGSNYRILHCCIRLPTKNSPAPRFACRSGAVCTMMRYAFLTNSDFNCMAPMPSTRQSIL